MWEKFLDLIRRNEAVIMTKGARILAVLCFLLALYYLVVLGKELGWI